MVIGQRLFIDAKKPFFTQYIFRRIFNRSKNERFKIACLMEILCNKKARIKLPGLYN